MESPDTPMHVGSVSVFEGEPFFDTHGRFQIDEVRSRILERIHLVPRLRQRVIESPFGRPVWVDDPSFDIANHVRVTELEGPGDDACLWKLTARLHMERLDRSRPLWEMWLVEGLARGRVGLVQKLHHAMVDGVSGVDVALLLLDLTPNSDRTHPEPWSPRPSPSTAAILADSMASTFFGPLRLPAAAIRAATHPGSAVAGLSGAAAAVRGFADGLAPRTSLNRQVGRGRTFVAVRVPLSDTKRAGKLLGGTVNDIALAAVTGGMRALVEARGDPVPPALAVLVPVSLRGAADHDTLGNRVGSIIARLPIGIADSVARLAVIHAELAAHKSRAEGEATGALIATADYLPHRLADRVATLVRHQPFVNMVVTNVPGPQMPLYAMGARLLHTAPVVPLGPNLDISVGILSYDGELTFGLFADTSSCPDLDLVAAGIAAAHADLVGAADLRAQQRRFSA